MKNNWQYAQNEITKWADEQFGVDRSTKKILTKLAQELIELIESPNSLEEYADCLMILLNAAKKEGYDMNTLYSSVISKLEVNKTREWKETEEGVYQHI